MTKQKFIIGIPIIIIAISVISVFVLKSKDNGIEISGVVERTEIDIASKIPGRIDSIYFNEGDIVKKGDIIAHLESKELITKVEQAKGILQAAENKFKMARNGTRPEEKETAAKLYTIAKYQYELAEKTWKRMISLYQDSVISTQEKDQIEFQFKSALEQMEAAKARYNMTINGARVEEINAAEGLFHQAENGFNETMAYFDELNIKSPIDGELCKRIIDRGEMVSSGYPIFTISDPSDTWVVLQLKETLLKDIKSGKILKGRIPALDNRAEDFKVTFISVMGEFANWRATNEKGDFDIKTFEVRLRSINKLPLLRPGMTVNFVLE